MNPMELNVTGRIVQYITHLTVENLKSLWKGTLGAFSSLAGLEPLSGESSVTTL